MNVSFRPVEFESQGATLRGRLYLPKDSLKKKYAIVIMAHGFTSTINHMTADKYAERFCGAGFAVLLYDHRNLGISDGQPRQEINFWVQARGYLDAIDFVYTLSETDTSKISVWGASLSAREAFLAGSIDDRINSIILLIPAFGDSFPTGDKDGSLYEFARGIIQSGDIMAIPHSKTEQMPVVSHDQIGHPSRLKELTAYRWFIEYGGRFGSHWQNAVSFATHNVPENFHIGQCTPHIKAPTLMIVAKNDEMEGAKPEVTKQIFNMLNQPGEWVDISGGHFGLLYYPGSIFEKASKAQIEFLQKHHNQHGA